MHPVIIPVGLCYGDFSFLYAEFLLYVHVFCDEAAYTFFFILCIDNTRSRLQNIKSTVSYQQGLCILFSSTMLNMHFSGNDDIV